MSTRAMMREAESDECPLKEGSESNSEVNSSRCEVLGSAIPGAAQRCRLRRKAIVLVTLLLGLVYVLSEECFVSGLARLPSTITSMVERVIITSDVSKSVKKYNRTGYGIGCTNWQWIQLWNHEVPSLSSCEAKCDEMSTCTSFAYVARPGCAGQTPQTCALWTGKCVGEPAPCWDTYEPYWETVAEATTQTLMTTTCLTAVPAAGVSAFLPAKAAATNRITTTRTLMTTAVPAATNRISTTRTHTKFSLASRDGIVLLTTAFLPSIWNQHVNEIYAALNTNLLNQHISAVHVLTESDCIELKQELVKWANSSPDGADILLQMDNKLTCVSTEDRTQPTYGDYFRYANNSLRDRVVLFSNGDVVFDDTLGKFDPGPIKRREHGYVLSVQSPPHNGAYRRALNQECDVTPMCVVGKWAGGGSWGQAHAGCSWDAYVFSPPLSSNMDLGHIDNLVMNFNGAENLAGFQLEVLANISLSNPCYHVHAFHWHCQGGKMHSQDGMVRADHPKWYMDRIGWPPHTRDAVSDIFPCWNCPGIKMPTGAVSTQSYCKYGTMLHSGDYEALRLNFRADFVNPGICCKDAQDCWKLPVQWLPHCIKAEDLDCVTWEAVHPHTVY